MSEHKRLMYINRQPSLWRHSCPAVKVTPQNDDDDETIGLSPLFLAPLNADFDGDTTALYVLHDTEALNEMFDKAYLKNCVTYDTNDSFLSTIRHEALYAAFVITEHVMPTYTFTEVPEELDTGDTNNFHITSLQLLPESPQIYNNYLTYPITVNGKEYTYGVCLFNKWCGFDDVKINETVGKNRANLVSRLIYENCDCVSRTFYKELKVLSNKLFFFITITNHSPTVNIKEMDSLVIDRDRLLFKKLPDNNVMLGHHVNEGLIERCIQSFDKSCQLYKLFKSGSRFSRTQLARSCINIGYSADAKNVIVNSPIKGNLLRGLTEEEFFSSAPGTRKSIHDKSEFTPDSGYLERTLVMALSILEITEDDCGGEHFSEIVVFNEKYAETIVGKYYKDPNNLTKEWLLLDAETAKSFINKKIYLRTVMNCSTPKFKMCRKCFGERHFSTRYLGIVAGQTISERLTQLIMRTFHTSGSAELPTDNAVRDFIKDYLIDINKTDDTTTLIFNNIDAPIGFESVPAFIDSEIGSDNRLYIKYGSLETDTMNKDTVNVLKSVQNLLKGNKSLKKDPIYYYTNMMTLLLQVGTPFSSFVEMVFANMFVTDLENRKFWRYHQSEKATLKLGDKVVARHLRPLLGLLYQPNKNTISEMDKIDELNLESEDLTIYEKIFLSKL